MIYPSELPDDKINHPEGDVFRALKRVSDKYDIFYERRFSGTTKGERKDYEIDFIVAKPNKAILILEAKGGLIEFRGEENSWYRNGKPLDKNPVDQVSGQWNSLIKRYPWLRDDIPFEWGLVFPNCEKVVGQKLPDSVHPGRVIDQVDLTKIEEKLNGIFHELELHNTHLRGTSKDNYRQFKNSLLRNYQFVQTLSTQILNQDQTFIELTEKQKKVVGGLKRNQKVLIEGVAGSGKTLIAQSMAEDFAENGQKVLFLCFNRALANVTADKFRNNGFEIKANTFHKYAQKRIAQFFPKWYNPPEKFELKQSWFELEVPSKLEEVTEISSNNYDVLILDEGQDFHDIWLEVLFKEVKPDGKILVFSDDEQNIFKRSNREIFKNWASYYLDENCRNTKNIIEFVNTKFNKNILSKVDSPQGDFVVEASFNNPEQLKSRLDEEIRMLLKKDKIKPHQIILLTNIGWASKLENIDSLGGLTFKPLNQNDGFEKDTIHFSTSRKFKGLESDIVFLIEENHPNDDQATTEQKLYVLVTRAKHRLYNYKLIE